MAAGIAASAAHDTGEPVQPELASSVTTGRVNRRANDHEARLVFALAGDVTDGELARGLKQCDSSRLVAAAVRENAIIAVSAALQRARRAGAAVPMAREVAFLALEAELRMRRLERRLQEVVAALTAANIDVTLLKGAALATTVYGSFAARPMNDLDLLVAADRALEAREIVRANGWMRDPTLAGDSAYANHHHLPPLLDASGSGLRVEIHTELLPPDNPFGLSREELARDSREVRVGSARAWVLSPTHHAVYAAIHFAWSHQLHLGGWHAIRDFGVLTRRGLLDYDALVDTARAWRAGTCLYWTLRLGRTLSGLPVPDDVLGRIEPRLPEALLRPLERHFVQTALRTGDVCPSVRLSRELWNVAMQPKKSGHRGYRPWLASTALIENGGRRMEELPGPRTPRDRLGHMFRWGRYLVRTL